MTDDDIGSEDAAAAARLDAEITAALRGRATPATDPTVLWLATTTRAVPPKTTYRRIAAQFEAEKRRRWRPAQMAAAVLAVLLLSHGASNIVSGDWIAAKLGEPYNAHVFFEGGIAFLAVGTAVLAGALDRRMLPIGVACGVPLGLTLAAHGAREVTVFAYGAVLHIAEGTLAIVLLVTWLYAMRYRFPRRSEDRS